MDERDYKALNEEYNIKRPMRDFEVVSKYLNENVKLPTRKTRYSAGYDIYNNGDTIKIYPLHYDIENAIYAGYTGISDVYGTKIKVRMQPDEVLKIYPRSSLGFKFHTVLVNGTGILDSDYYNNESNEGEIFVKFFNFGEEIVTINHGDAFAQGIFQKYLTTDSDDLYKKSIRIGGIGSTNKWLYMKDQLEV